MTQQSSHASDAQANRISAADYAAMGFSPIMLYGLNADGTCMCNDPQGCAQKRSQGKHPVGNRWQTARIDAERVDRYLAQGGNVGLRMGDQPDGSRYLALDEDEDGALAKGEALWGPLPETLTSRTGSGGRHCIYAWPSDKPYPRNKVRAGGFKYDIRAQDSQIVVEPSRNVNGAYTWIDFREPAPLPDAWVTALLADAPRDKRGKTAPKREHVATADADERTARLLEAIVPFWEPPDANAGRRMRFRAFGGYLARCGWDDEQIAAFARALPTARPEETRVALALEGAKDARNLDKWGHSDAAGWNQICDWSTDAAAVIESIAKDPRQTAEWRGIWNPRLYDFHARVEATWAKRAARKQAEAEAEQRAATDTTEDSGPPGDVYILQDRNDAEHILLWERERGYQPVAVRSLRLCIKQQGLDDKIQLSFETSPERGEKRTVQLTPQKIIEQNARQFSKSIYDFGAQVSLYDDDADAVVVGYPAKLIEPRFDADVDAWLRAIGGPEYPKLEAWIVPQSQRSCRLS